MKPITLIINKNLEAKYRGKLHDMANATDTYEEVMRYTDTRRFLRDRLAHPYIFDRDKLEDLMCRLNLMASVLDDTIFSTNNGTTYGCIESYGIEHDTVMIYGRNDVNVDWRSWAICSPEGASKEYVEERNEFI